MDENVLEKKNFVIKKSAQLFYYKGYVNTGVNEIIKSCGIPKGSFYYYFKSKEELLIEVIDYDANIINNLFDETVDDLSIVKLRTFFNKYFNNIIENNCHGGSLMGNLALEMADINENIRLKILSVYLLLERKIALFLKMIVITNPIYSHIDPGLFSKILINQMEGTMLKLKIHKDEEEKESFFKIFDYLLYKKF